MSRIGRRQVVVVPGSRTPDVGLLPIGERRHHLRVARDLYGFDPAFLKSDLVVLDAALPAQPGGFDASSAAHVYSSHEPNVPILVWVDRTPSSVHLAEMVGEALAWHLPKIHGVICSVDPNCLLRACAAAMNGVRWHDDHVHGDPLAITSKRLRLAAILRNDNALSRTLIALAARPEASWRELGDLVHLSERTLNTALGRDIQPALERLGWLHHGDSLNRSRLVALVQQRRAFIEHFVLGNRTDLRPLFI